MKIRTLLALVRIEPEDPGKICLGFVENPDGTLGSLMSTVKKGEGSAVAALKMAKEYIEVEVEWIDIQEVSFFDIVERDTIVLAYRVRLPSTVSMHKNPVWVTMEELKDVYQKIDDKELQIQLRCISV